MTITIAKKSTASKFTKGDGGHYVYTDSVTAPGAPAVNDVYKFLVPAGIEVTSVVGQFTQMDSNGSPTLAFKMGYEAVDSASPLVASTTYFAAAGQTTARAGGRSTSAFAPIVFNEDVYITLTWTAVAATYVAAQDVWLLVGANVVGIK